MKMLRYVHAFIDRHGRPRCYFRRAGFKKVPLPGMTGSGEFMRAYDHAVAGQPLPIGASRVVAGSIRAVAASYYTSPDYLAMKANSQRVRRNIIDRFCRELGGDGKPRGDRSAAGLQKAHVVKYVADRSAKPDSANGLRKVLRALMQHAISLKLRADDPTRDVKALRSKNRSGFHRWTDGEIAQFEARHAIGTKPRLAMALGLYFGQARQDIVAMGRQHVRDEVLYGRG